MLAIPTFPDSQRALRPGWVTSIFCLARFHRRNASSTLEGKRGYHEYRDIWAHVGKRSMAAAGDILYAFGAKRGTHHLIGESGRGAERRHEPIRQLLGTG